MARPHGLVGQRHGQMRVRKEEKTRPICTYQGPPLRYVLPPDALLGEARPCAPSPVFSLPVIVPPATASSCNTRPCSGHSCLSCFLTPCLYRLLVIPSSLPLGYSNFLMCTCCASLPILRLSLHPQPEKNWNIR